MREIEMKRVRKRFIIFKTIVLLMCNIHKFFYVIQKSSLYLLSILC